MRGWIAFLGLWFCLASSAVAETRVALVIGNSGYGGVAALSNPKGDAALIAQTLGSEGFEVTLVQDATRAAMLNGLRSFSDEADRADWAVVYYAGHGIEVGGINYLLPTDAELREDRDVQDEAISLNRVLDAVANARKLRLVILDACRTNPFAVTMKRSISARAVDRGLAPAEPPAGILVVYAAAAGQVAEDGGGDHSPFTAALARRMLEPGLEVSHLFNVVTADVLDATGHRQRPYQYGSNPTREEFYFEPPAPAVVTSDGRSAFEQTWSILKATTDAGVLKAFLGSLPPEHPLRGQVEARIGALSLTAPNTAATPTTSSVSDSVINAAIDAATTVDQLAPLLASLPDGPLKERANARLEVLKKAHVVIAVPVTPSPASTQNSTHAPAAPTPFAPQVTLPIPTDPLPPEPRTLSASDGAILKFVAGIPYRTQGADRPPDNSPSHQWNSLGRFWSRRFQRVRRFTTVQSRTWCRSLARRRRDDPRMRGRCNHVGCCRNIIRISPIESIPHSLGRSSTTAKA